MSFDGELSRREEIEESGLGAAELAMGLVSQARLGETGFRIVKIERCRCWEAPAANLGELSSCLAIFVGEEGRDALRTM